MKKLNVLELFAGTECISSAFRSRNHNTLTVDWNKEFPSDIHMDISKITKDLILEKGKEKFGRTWIPDVVWIAFDCTSYSLAAISHHRIKNPITGNLDPKSEYARFCDECNQHVLKVLDELMELNPKLIFFIENPRATLQNMIWMKPYDKYKYLITYCKYQTDLPIEKRRMKPTNIWTNHPNPCFEPPCKNGASCHARAPRGSRTGTQGLKGAKERSQYPHQLCEHIVDICECKNK